MSKHDTSDGILHKVTAQTHETLAIVLAMIAGYVDAYGFVNYRAYMSFMSGNTTQSGLRIGHGDFAEATPTLLAIVAFVFGVFVGTLLISSGIRQSQRFTFGSITALLAINICGTQLDVFGDLVNIASLSFAMGAMNTTVSHVGAEKTNLTFVTGTLNKIGSHFALALRRVSLKDAQGEWDTHLRRAVLLLGLWAAFLWVRCWPEQRHLDSAFGFCCSPS